MPATVLVIDDDPDLRALLQDVLDLEGYTVITVATAPAGLAQAQAHHPDLILLDYQLPYQDGPWFAAAYRVLPGPHAPVVLITAATAAEQRAQGVGANAFLGKPFDVDALLRLVTRFVAHAPGG